MMVIFKYHKFYYFFFYKIINDNLFIKFIHEHKIFDDVFIMFFETPTFEDIESIFEIKEKELKI